MDLGSGAETVRSSTSPHATGLQPGGRDASLVAMVSSPAEGSSEIRCAVPPDSAEAETRAPPTTWSSWRQWRTGTRYPSFVFFAGLVCGAIIGAGIATVLAPESGEATRRRLQRAAGDLRETASDRRAEFADDMIGPRGRHAQGREGQVLIAATSRDVNILRSPVREWPPAGTGARRVWGGVRVDARPHHGHWRMEGAGAVSSHSSEGSVPGM